MDTLLFQWLTAWTGSSVRFDLIVENFATNELLKAGIVGGCLLAAWVAGSGDTLRQARRRLLLVACAALCTVAMTKMLGRWISIPRAYVLTQSAYRFENDRLVPYAKTAFHTPLTKAGRERQAGVDSGFIPGNDWESFPSDHAGFFGALAFGLLWVNRRIGAVALFWTLAVILPGKMLRGFHTPADLAAGLGLALLVVMAFRLLETLRPVEWLAGLSLRYDSLATCLFFGFAVEAMFTLNHLQDAALFARDLIRGIA